MPRTCKVCKTKFEPTYNSVQTNVLLNTLKNKERRKKKKTGTKEKRCLVCAYNGLNKLAFQCNLFCVV